MKDSIIFEIATLENKFNNSSPKNLRGYYSSKIKQSMEYFKMNGNNDPKNCSLIQHVKFVIDKYMLVYRGSI